MTPAKPMSERDLYTELTNKAWREVPMAGALLLTVDDAFDVARRYAQSAAIKPLKLKESSRGKRENMYCNTAVGFYEIGKDGFCYSPWVCKYPDYETALAAITKDYMEKAMTLLNLPAPPATAADDGVKV